MGLWGQGDELAVEVTARQGHRELRRNVLIQLTEEQLAIIEEIARVAWLLFEENAVDLRGYLE
jgi:DNA-binding MarR family transcriptional regulator